MKSALLALLTGAALALPIQAQAMEWGDVSLPVRGADWQQLDERKRIAYLTGALQASAYLNAETRSQIGCIADLIDPLLEETMRADFEDTLVFAVASKTLGDCENASGPAGELISSTTLSGIVGGPDSGDLWIGINVGVADYVHFHAFANAGEDMADCMQDETLAMLGYDRANPYEWTDNPDNPFVLDVIGTSFANCE